MKPKLITVEELECSFSAAVTRSECRRFLHCFPHHADARLASYCKWRERNGLSSNLDSFECEGTANASSSDIEDWNHSFTRAIAHQTHQPSNSVLSSNPGGRLRKSRVLPSPSALYRDGVIPQLLLCHTADASPLRDIDGHRILHCLPAMIDLHSHHSIEVFIATLALYLDAKFDRSNEEQVVLVIDVRPGRGWPNPPALQMVGFVRQVARALHELHPGRLHRCIIFPVPSVALCLWNAVRRFVDPSLTERVVVVVGGADLESPPPRDKLLPHLDFDILAVLEAARLGAFV